MKHIHHLRFAIALLVVTASVAAKPPPYASPGPFADDQAQGTVKGKITTAGDKGQMNKGASGTESPDAAKRPPPYTGGSGPMNPEPPAVHRLCPGGPGCPVTVQPGKVTPMSPRPNAQ